MPKTSEQPTAPPSFDAVEYERDSELRMRAARRASEAAALEMPPSQTRIATHPKIGAAMTDEAWAQQTIGEPVVAVSAALLRHLPLDHRTGFLLSLMDGTMDLEAVVDVSAMTRADALRIVRRLFESGVIVFR